jgi:Ca2+-binding RTX toxin-like protein
VSANGGRVLLFESIGGVTMDLDDVEVIELRPLGGVDDIVVGDLSGTDTTRVDIDLRGALGGGDGEADTVTVNATQAADTVTVAGDAGGIEIQGLSAAVGISFQEVIDDRLTLNGQGGDDVLNATGLQTDGIQLTMNGGLGDDFLLGSARGDLFFGGDGDDVALMGAGNDTFIWNPGDDSDIVEGQAGLDTLQFNGANVAERIDIAANGGRARFLRDIGTVFMDLNDVETIDFNALGGADLVTVHDLAGTDITKVAIDLGIGGVADSQADRIFMEGTAAADALSVHAAAGLVEVDGLGTATEISHFDSLDTLAVNASGGQDTVTLDDLTGSGLTRVTIDLGGADGQADQATIGATSGADTLSISSDGALVSVGGLAAAVVLSGAEAALDRLVVDTGAGNDVVDASGLAPGVVKLTIDAGAGSDTVTGSGGADLVLGDSGNDRIVDRDFVNFDVYDGGTGVDTIDYSNVIFADAIVTINLGIGKTSVAGGNTETVSHFENVVGSQGGETIVGNELANLLDGAAGNDSLSGHDGDDRLLGGAGADDLTGGGGNDRLDGGAGSDRLAGSDGADRLTGGLDADSFVFSALGHSTVQPDGRDILLDFDHAQGDLIDVSLIDADRGLAGNQAFAFIGSAAFSGAAGELRTRLVNGNTLVLGDIDGNAVADFGILVKGVTTLQAGDFSL